MYFIVNKQTRELIRQSNTPFNIDDTVQPPLPNIQLKRVDNPAVPQFDSATQKLAQQFADDDAAFTRTFRLVVAPMTTEELASYQQRQNDLTTLNQLRAVYQDLVDGTGTQLQRLQRVEKAAAYSIKDQIRNTLQSLKP